MVSCSINREPESDADVWRRGCDGLDHYQIKAWRKLLHSPPIRRMMYADFSAEYEMCVAHILLLRDETYAFVSEVGCSCWEPEQAEITLLPNFEKAEELLRAWIKINREQE